MGQIKNIKLHIVTDIKVSTGREYKTRHANMDNSLPVFIDLAEKEQAAEIRQYLMSAGADLSENPKESIQEELSCLLDACDNWLKSAPDADLQGVMNSFISLILYCSFDEKLTRKLISKLVEMGASSNNALLRIWYQRKTRTNWKARI